MVQKDVLAVATAHARAFIAGLEARPVGQQGTHATLAAALAGELPEDGVDAAQVVDELARAVEPGLVATAGPRFFGFVIGGRLPAALGADWLTSVWDQNASHYATSAAASVVEEVAAGWLLDLLHLPKTASVGFVTGGQMANFTCLAAARHAVLARAGWDVEADGLYGAPPLHVVAGADAHVTIRAALRYLGLGTKRVRQVATDAQGRMQAAALGATLAGCEGPTIVCAAAGNVCTGAFDRFTEIVPIAHARGAWVHVDGAFGLWAAASPRFEALTAGLQDADSWGVDAHKWLNVPYDCGVAIVADPSPHRAALSSTASYIVPSGDARRDAMDWVPEFSRRARGFAVYAALRSLGRRGVAELVDRCCMLAERMAESLAAEPGVEILNDVVLNQVLVRFHAGPGEDPGRHTENVIARVQADGTCWLGGTRWRGATAMRISFSNATTTEADVDRSAAAIRRLARD